MRATSVESLVKEHAPVRRGHFLLSSGMHTPYYVELEAIVQDPSLTATVCHAIAERFQEQQRARFLHRLASDRVGVLGRRFETIAMRADGSELPVELPGPPVRRPGGNFW